MKRILAALCLTLLLQAPCGFAAEGGNGLEGVPAGLVRSVEQETGGRVLAAERAQRDGRPGIRFRVLTPNGRIRHVWRPLRDAGTGR